MRPYIVVLLGALLLWGAALGDAAAGDIPRAIEAALRKRAGHDLACERLAFTDIGGNGFQASGCSRRATYVCAEGRGEVVCSRDSQIESTSAPRVEPTGNVSRRYDETRQLHVVSGKFSGFDRHVVIEMTGAPQAVLDRIHVRGSMPGIPSNATACETYAIRVNDQPFAGIEVRANVDRGVWKSDVKAQFLFGNFRPLGRRHSTFAIDFCGAKLVFSEAQIDELRKFLEIFSQVAQDVQAGQLEQRVPPAADTVAL